MVSLNSCALPSSRMVLVSSQSNRHRLSRHLPGSHTSATDITVRQYVQHFTSDPTAPRHSTDSDLSFVGHEDCRHMRFDFEISTPFEILCKPTRYILVSLPMIAWWHSTKQFDAEQILQQSGEFDYSSPQFFLVYKLNSTFMRPSTRFDRITLCYEQDCSADSVDVDVLMPTARSERISYSSVPSCHTESGLYSASILFISGWISSVFNIFKLR